MNTFEIIKISNYDQQNDQFTEKPIFTPVKFVNTKCRKEAFNLYLSGLSKKIRKEYSVNLSHLNATRVNFPVSNGVEKIVVKKSKIK